MTSPPTNSVSTSCGSTRPANRLGMVLDVIAQVTGPNTPCVDAIAEQLTVAAPPRWRRAARLVVVTAYIGVLTTAALTDRRRTPGTPDCH